MGTRKEVTTDKCKICASFIVEIYMKNPFIDDFETECPKCHPGQAMNLLSARSNAAAKEEREDY